MYKLAKNYEENLRYINNGDPMFVKSSCHDGAAETNTYFSDECRSADPDREEFRIGMLGVFDDIV